MFMSITILVPGGKENYGKKKIQEITLYNYRVRENTNAYLIKLLQNLQHGTDFRPVITNCSRHQ